MREGEVQEGIGLLVAALDEKQYFENHASKARKGTSVSPDGAPGANGRGGSSRGPYLTHLPRQDTSAAEARAGD